MTFIGLNSTGIVELGVADAPVKIGDLTRAPVLLSIFGFLLITGLMIHKIPGTILIGILSTTILAFFFGISEPPQSWISTPPSLVLTFLQLDLSGALDIGFGTVILTVFIMAFVDTMGTLICVSSRAGFLDEDGNLPQIEKLMLADALATTFAGLVGTTTAGVYIESASGVEAGRRSGYNQHSYQNYKHNPDCMFTIILKDFPEPNIVSQI